MNATPRRTNVPPSQYITMTLPNCPAKIPPMSDPIGTGSPPAKRSEMDDARAIIESCTEACGINQNITLNAPGAMKVGKNRPIDAGL